MPVMDLSARFNRPGTDVTKRTCIVIVEVANEDQDSQVMGVVVDAVNAVLEIPPTEIEPPPAFGARIRADYIGGLAKVNGKFVILLDVNQVLSIEDLGGTGAAHGASVTVGGSVDPRSRTCRRSIGDIPSDDQRFGAYSDSSQPLSSVAVVSRRRTTKPSIEIELPVS